MLTAMLDKAAQLCRHPKFEDIHLSIGRVATQEEVKHIESEIGIEFPQRLKTLFMETALAVEFEWHLNDEHPVKIAGQDIYWGGGQLWSLVNAGELLHNHRMWATNERPFWHGKFPVMQFANADMLALDTSSAEERLAYLDHNDDAEETNSFMFDCSLDEFLHDWLTLGCAGPEAWILEIFFAPDTRRLNLGGENAKEWRAAFK